MSPKNNGKQEIGKSGHQDADAINFAFKVSRFEISIKKPFDAIVEGLDLKIVADMGTWSILRRKYQPLFQNERPCGNTALCA